MVGKPGYDFKIRELYQREGTSWLTPVEIFQPYYGEAVARYLAEDILQARSKAEERGGDRRNRKIHVCEVGAGNGTLAANVLDFMLERHPDIYSELRYTVLDVSKGLCERQESLVGLHNRNHESHFQSLVGNACDGKSWEGLLEGGERVYVLGLEVLDNLPHDRIEKVDGKWMETWVSYESESHPNGVEELREMRDDVILSCFDAYDWTAINSEKDEEQKKDGGFLATLETFITTGSTKRAAAVEEGDSSRVVFLPTTAFSILRNIRESFPEHTLLLIDFNALPDVQIRGRNAPLVSDTVNALANDFTSYLVPVGSADIFFPTNFGALKAMYETEIFGCDQDPQCARQVDVSVRSSADFFKDYADLDITTTLSGYNPLIDDFTNTRVFVASSSHKKV